MKHSPNQPSELTTHSNEVTVSDNAERIIKSPKPAKVDKLLTNSLDATARQVKGELEHQRRLGQSLNDWRTPIEFYGKVVDEVGKAIAEAKVNFSCNDLSKEGTSYYHTVSDGQGLFSISGITGKLLTVHVTKDGYYPSKRDNDSFYYAGQNANFSPDVSNPVLFHLRKKGKTEPLIWRKRSYVIPRDGTAVAIDLATGKAITNGIGDILVQCWTKDQDKQRGRRYDWQCVVTIPGGGIIMSDQEFNFVAPEEGYVPTAEISMSADRADWKSDVDLKFFYRLSNGRYGRMIFSMIAGGQHFCMIDSLLNPSGSRNLEFDPGNAIQAGN